MLLKTDAVWDNGWRQEKEWTSDYNVDQTRLHDTHVTNGNCVWAYKLEMHALFLWHLEPKPNARPVVEPTVYNVLLARSVVAKTQLYGYLK